MAHCLARVIYQLVSEHRAYDDSIFAALEAEHDQRQHEGSSAKPPTLATPSYLQSQSSPSLTPSTFNFPTRAWKAWFVAPSLPLCTRGPPHRWRLFLPQSAAVPARLR